MRKIKRNPEPHIVYVDTSTLWHEDKRFSIDPNVNEFFEKYESDFSISLMIPEVVKGELISQQSHNAIKILNKANESINSVSHITGKRYSHRVTDKRIKNEVSERINKWMASRKATVLSTPIDSIDWIAVIEDSLWRNAPFSHDKEEKGFRDYMILETIVKHASNYDKDHQLVFLCKDKLLRETAESRMRSDERFITYEYTNDLKSYLDLTKQELEDKFIKSILKRANTKFWEPGNLNSLYHKESISSKVRDKYSRYFESPSESEKRPVEKIAGLLSKYVNNNWESRNSGTFWIYSPQFGSVENENIFHWKSPIYFVQAFSNNMNVDLPTHMENINERILVLKFVVNWKSKVTADGRFRECILGDISLEENDFRIPSADDKAHWNIKQ